ncbi:hypothetical protein TNIN_27881 [Trichonephila inaurata madagascariensis]|uniref:Uncharacterized protein n=1 Tax=Trichonephila inaurata madagascariensis TaxID=2747483 RepID=A0A8X6XKK4_9ARAC|nr:hypothetical protein TNIN_27881 [Trichonephila inaurata madagascariensis]
MIEPQSALRQLQNPRTEMVTKMNRTHLFKVNSTTSASSKTPLSGEKHIPYHVRTLAFTCFVSRMDSYSSESCKLSSYRKGKAFETRGTYERAANEKLLNAPSGSSFITNGKEMGFRVCVFLQYLSQDRRF